MLYNVHTHSHVKDENVFSIVNQYPEEIDLNIPNISIGIHPWYLNVSLLNTHLSLIEKGLQTKNCLAIGECGLDKRIQTSLEIQKKVLIPQLEMAQHYKKPVILHCVAAYQEIIEIKKIHNISVPMVIHGFSKNIQVAQSLLKNDFYLSFGKYLLRNDELASVFKSISKEQILLETDTIEETIHDVYAKAQSIRNENIESLVESNFNRVFNP